MNHPVGAHGAVVVSGRLTHALSPRVLPVAALRAVPKAEFVLDIELGDSLTCLVGNLVGTAAKATPTNRYVIAHNVGHAQRSLHDRVKYVAHRYSTEQTKFTAADLFVRVV